MRRLILTAALAFAAYLAGAQTAYDGIRFAENEYFGTARSMGMGNAFTALGGDLGSIGINPAGSAVSRYSQIVFSGGLNVSVSDALGTTIVGESSPFCFDERMKTNRTSAILPNTGFVVNFKTNRSRGVKDVSVGFVSNMTANFLDKTYAQGFHNGTSFAGYMASSANGTPYTELDSDDSYNYQGMLPVLAWQSGMIGRVGDETDRFAGVTELFVDKEGGGIERFTGGPLKQNYGRLQRGYKHDCVLNVGMNISDWIFVGANLGIISLNYSFDDYIEEAAVDKNDFRLDFGTQGKACFTGLKYSYFYTAKGTGVYGKFGLIMTPGNIVRIGLAVQTPAAMTISETWGASADVTFDNRKFNGSASSPECTQKYRFTDPFRFNAGVATTIGGFLALSADYELSDYSAMRFRALYNDSDSYFNDITSEAREVLSVAHQLRVGAEFKPLDCLALRAGYNLNTSGIKGFNGVNHAPSFGIGYSSNGSFFCDAAARCLIRKDEFIYPYGDYSADPDVNLQVPTPEILNYSYLWSVVATIGFRF